MTHLLDVNVLLAAIWTEHPNHTRTFAWLTGKDVAVCPISELGFIRISTNIKAPFKAPMDSTRTLLESFLKQRNVKHIPADIPALEAQADNSDALTDVYLAELAARHEMKLATLDKNILHPAATVI